MSGILAPLILGAGAIGLFFNVCMLRIRIFYQKLRPLVICQLVFQIMILSMNTTEAWKRLYSTQHDQTEAVFGSKMIKLSMAVLLPFNIVAITAFLQSLHSLGRSESRYITLKLFVTSSIALGCFDFTMLWLQSRNFAPQAATVAILSLYFLLLFFALALINSMNRSQGNAKTVFLCAIYQRTLHFFAVWIIMNWVLVFALLGLPHLSRDLLGEKNVFLLISFMVNLFTGIILPFGFIVVFNNSQWKDYYKNKTVVVIV